MEILSVYDDAFSSFGKVLDGFDTRELLQEMAKFEIPETGRKYQASVDAFEKLDICRQLEEREYGGMPIQIGLNVGRNRKLDCLEYHRDSEVNIGQTDVILLLARRDEMEEDKLDTSKVKAFCLPAGVAIEVFATTLHFAPINTLEDGYFRCAVILPRGTNEPFEPGERVSVEDKMLWARNKWLLAHEDAPQAKNGAYIGLIGKNIDLDEE